MRSKMLSSIDMILDAVSDITTIGKTIRTTYAVTINSDQMPIRNQVWCSISFDFSHFTFLFEETTIYLIEKIRQKLFDISSIDDPAKIYEQAAG